MIQCENQPETFPYVIKQFDSCTDSNVSQFGGSNESTISISGIFRLFDTAGNQSSIIDYCRINNHANV
jgi:hypothetical protein